MILITTVSLTVSTFHSHHDIQWNRSIKHADTGHTLTVDSSQCPVCGYLFKAGSVPAVSSTQVLAKSTFIQGSASLAFLSYFQNPVSGRSPPASS
ncbi:MAG: hypothetical protein JJ953_05510 [Gracilimonas sp.]|uniref:hypothetical protein n=1 Tax=Gracilimonas sediminicola TaxID=2952158 RepID=UPI001B1C1CCE|nr:hypothetical protein [Gracilimonas sp.]MBO6616538.1 hypothetical protein [Gracilimonas sp.]